MGTTERQWHLEWKATEVQGRTARYGEAGSGTPFIFLHGWGLRDRTYKRALARVARLGVRVLAPSLPGFGGTARLTGDNFSMDGYARWVSDFAAAVGVEGDYYLGGHSFGGGVAILTAHNHGDNCRLLVLINSIGGAVWRNDTNPDTDAEFLTDRPLWDWGIRFPGDVASRGSLGRTAPVIIQDALRNLVRDPLGFWRVGGLARNANLLGELEALKQRGLPVVVVWGDEDDIVPSASLDAIVEAAGSEPTVVRGSHSWLLADPDQFGEVMTNVVSVAERARTLRRDAATPRSGPDPRGEPGPDAATG